MYHNSDVIYKNEGILLGGLSDCAELVEKVNHANECVTDLEKKASFDLTVFTKLKLL